MSLEGLRVAVCAGPHSRYDCPVMLPLPECVNERTWCVRDDSGATLPLQRLGDNEAAFIVPALEAGGEREFRLVEGSPSAGGVRVDTSDPSRVRFLLNSSLVTSYNYGSVPARPFFYPLIAPGGRQVTRRFPMDDHPGEARDHPHHRSLWIAFGEVNGVDNWSEEAGHGSTRHQAIHAVESGPVFGSMASASVWTSSSGDPVLDEALEVRLWATGGDTTLIDFDIRLSAAYGDVHFGDTKEGGILSARVASEMDAVRGGRIENSYGGVNEAETWGKSAHWCDYSGSVDGMVVGLTIMDHPLSFRYPTHWHVRNYGLMTANPFGYSAYTGGKKDGSFTLARGAKMPFRYRVVLHRGDAASADIRAKYLDFVSPPTMTLRRDNVKS